jgi:hypothetical protein
VTVKLIDAQNTLKYHKIQVYDLIFAIKKMALALFLDKKPFKIYILSFLWKVRGCIKKNIVLWTISSYTCAKF